MHQIVADGMSDACPIPAFRYIRRIGELVGRHCDEEKMPTPAPENDGVGVVHRAFRADEMIRRAVRVGRQSFTRFGETNHQLVLLQFLQLLGKCA